MICALNRQHVVGEVLRWGELKAAEALGCHPDLVRVRLQPVEGGYQTVFEVPEIDADTANAVLAPIQKRMKEIVMERLEGLDIRRAV